jgi:hypothetical protein
MEGFVIQGTTLLGWTASSGVFSADINVSFVAGGSGGAWFEISSATGHIWRHTPGTGWTDLGLA